MPIKYTLKSFLIIVLLSAGLISGDNMEKGSLVNTNYAPAPQPAQQMAPAVQPVQQAAPAPAAATGLQAQPNSAAPKLNPKHGLPGHRCDLPEGVPLDVQEGTNLKALNAGKVPAAAPKLNPKHGDPGHRCDIAVGAPL
jgi:hypothetical protein